MNTLLQRKKAPLASFCAQHHIYTLALFGSALKLPVTQVKDIELLAHFDPEKIPHLFDCIAMESTLSALLGFPVDLRTPHDLSPHFRKDLLKQARIIFQNGSVNTANHYV